MEGRREGGRGKEKEEKIEEMKRQERRHFRTLDQVHSPEATVHRVTGSLILA